MQSPAEQDSPSVEQASTALRLEHGRAATPPASVLVRRDFLARRTPMRGLTDRSTRERVKPPLARLVTRGGLSLRLELLLLFLAQCGGAPRRSPGRLRHPVEGDPDAGVHGLLDFLATGNRRQPRAETSRPASTMRLKQLETGLGALREEGLVLAHGDGFGDLRLAREGGATDSRGASEWKPAPTTAAATATVSVPISFYTYGWIQVMSDSEIAAWLMWRDHGGMRTPAARKAVDLSLTADQRLGVYDLTRDTWDSHLMLTATGLMTTHPGDSAVTQTPGGPRFKREPHRFDVVDDALEQAAIHAMLAAVTERRDSYLRP